jgi:hypothetical protein
MVLQGQNHSPVVCPCCRADAGRHLRDCPPRRDPLLGWYAGMDVADANPERDRNTTDRRQYQGVGATIRQRRERTLFKRASAGRRRRSAHGATASHQPLQQRRQSQVPRPKIWRRRGAHGATASHQPRQQRRKSQDPRFVGCLQPCKQLKLWLRFATDEAAAEKTLESCKLNSRSAAKPLESSKLNSRSATGAAQRQHSPAAPP